MNQDTLKLDLCARLLHKPYYMLSRIGHLNLDAEYGSPYEASQPLKVTNVLPSEKGIEVEWTHEDSGWGVGYCEVDEALPVLFNSFTEEITINGKTFVPIDRLAKELELNVIEYNWLKENPHMIINTARFVVTEKLNAWHINYRLSEDEFIPVTEEFNPYK